MKAKKATEDRSSKRPRLTRSCDFCRGRKVRCDSADSPSNVCTNCTNANVQCTHVEATKSLGLSKGYVESLERRLTKLERAFRRHLPHVDLAQILAEDAPEGDVEHVEVIPGPKSDEPPRNDISFNELNQAINEIIPQPKRLGVRFFGRSCPLYLVQAVLQQKQLATGAILPMTHEEIFFSARPEFAEEPEDYPSPDFYCFPDHELLRVLSDAYFANFNRFLPLLHRPTFELNIKNRLHLTDDLFGASVLLVCALGARISDTPSANSYEPRGWEWYSQVDIMRTVLQTSPTLHEIHVQILAALYSQTIGRSYTMSTRIGVGFRRLFDAGAHMRRSGPPNVTNELWKRAFWVLFFLDVTHNTILGRPFALQYEDFDVQYPLECDDEYWENVDESRAFKQPPGTHSSITYFVHLLKLTTLLFYIKNLVYSVRQPLRLCDGQQRPTDSDIIMHFDSNLNKWLEALPPHLQWKTDHSDQFFLPAAFLHSTYHYVRLLIHRPFIPLPSVPSASVSNSSSLLVCVNAARSCLRIAEAVKARSDIYSVHVLTCYQCSVYVLLLWVWRNVHSKQEVLHSREFMLARDLMNILQDLEEKISLAGTMRDILVKLTDVPDSFPESSGPIKKRPCLDLTDDSTAAIRWGSSLSSSLVTGPDMEAPLENSAFAQTAHQADETLDNWLAAHFPPQSDASRRPEASQILNLDALLSPPSRLSGNALSENSPLAHTAAAMSSWEAWRANPTDFVQNFL